MGSGVKVTLNRSLLKAEIRAQVPRAIGPEVKARLIKKFDKIKKQFIEELRNHPVTQEIKGGASSPNLSGTLGGYGNLYSFLGFDEGDPTAPLGQLIDRISFKITNFNSRLRARAQVQNFPTEQEVAGVTPLPWAAGLSWAQGIHNGNIPNFGHYMNKDFRNSRSGKGMQVKEELTGRVFVGDESYIMGMLLKYRKLFKEMEV